jgi:hypothetical protein
MPATAPHEAVRIANTPEVLAGVKSVHVHVEMDCEGREFDEQAIKREAEQELIRVGIAIRRPLDADGILYVYAQLARSEEIPVYGGSVGAEYLEVVTNRRGCEVAGGIVWHRRGSLITSESNLQPAIEGAMEGVREFCREHRNANPKKPPPDPATGRRRGTSNS